MALGDHGVRAVVGVLVTLVVAEFLHQSGRRVADVQRHRQGAALAHLGQGCIDRDIGGVGFRRGGQVGDRLGQRDAPLGQADDVQRLLGGHRDLQGARVGVADVLGGEDDHAPGDEQRILAGLEHPRQPVDGGVGVGAAQTLDEGGDDVVVLFAALVVEERGLLQGGFHRGETRSPRLR